MPVSLEKMVPTANVKASGPIERDAMTVFIDSKLRNNDPIMLKSVLSANIIPNMYFSDEELHAHDLKNNRGEALAYSLSNSDLGYREWLASR